MCVTDKQEVIIARFHRKEVYICPITEEGQIEGIIRIPIEQHETESFVSGVAFDVTYEEDIVILRYMYTSHLESSFQIEVYSRNGVKRNFYPLPGNQSVSNDFDNMHCLLSNPKGIVAVVRYTPVRPRLLFEPGTRPNQISFWHLVGKAYVIWV